MSDRFDITLERKLETKPGDGGDDVVGVRRIELITGRGRRREWSRREKACIVVESAAPGANVSEVARRNGLSPQQLFAWRREARELLAECVPSDAATAAKPTVRPKCKPSKRTVAAPRSAETQSFAPVVVVAAGTAPPASPPPDKTRGAIEIVIGDVLVRVRGAVDATTLNSVLQALRRSS